MIKSVYLGLAAIFVAGMISSGCQHNLPEQEAKLRVKILIDGSDSIYLQRNKMWIEHHAYQLPGQYNGLNEPIYLNDYEWTPEWFGNKSEVFRGVRGSLPEKEFEVALDVVRGHNNVMITQQPSENNEYTMVVTIDDRDVDGAQWFVLDFDW